MFLLKNTTKVFSDDYACLITQLVAASATGGIWRFYSKNAPEYTDWCNLLQRYANTPESKERPISYRLLKDGVLFYCTYEQIVEAVPILNTYYAANLPEDYATNYIKNLCITKQTESIKELAAWLNSVLNTNNGISTIISFGIYSSSFLGKKQCVTSDNEVYPLYKLDAVGTFRAIYNLWIQQGKTPLYLCKAGSKEVTNLETALEKYHNYFMKRKAGTLSKQEQRAMQEICYDMLLPNLTALYSGEALMCSIMKR